MARVKLGSHPSHGFKVAEILNASKQLTSHDSGKVFYFRQDLGNATFQLPKLGSGMAGWHARFILQTLGSYNVRVVGGGMAGTGTGGQGGSPNNGVNDISELGSVLTPSGAWQASQSHVDAAQSATSGSGSGVKANITTDGDGNPTVNSITYIGEGFAIGDTITFTDPGSSSNTATVTVTSIRTDDDANKMTYIEVSATDYSFHNTDGFGSSSAATKIGSSCDLFSDGERWYCYAYGAVGDEFHSING